MQKNENKMWGPRDLNPGPLAPKAGVLPSIPLFHKENFEKKLRFTTSNAKSFVQILEGISNGIYSMILFCIFFIVKAERN